MLDIISSEALVNLKVVKNLFSDELIKNNLETVVSILGIIIGFVLGIASYLLSHQEPEIRYDNFGDKHDTYLVLGQIDALIELKEKVLNCLPFIYLFTFLGLILMLVTNSLWVIIFYCIGLIIIFFYSSRKIHEIIKINVEISKKIHEMNRNKFNEKITKQ